jgi:uncharacterized membrane protein YphA (DoxX/SURF4 family)
MTTTTTEIREIKPKSFTRFFPPIARVLMGLLFLAFGIMGLFNLMSPPPNMPDAAKNYFEALVKMGYMLKFISGTEALVGALLLVNRFVPLALALIAPIILNIVAYHVFVAPSGFQPAAVVLFLELYLAWAYRKSFLPMLAPRTSPA